MSSANGIIRRLLAEVMRDSHAYVPGLEQRRPTSVPRPRAERFTVLLRERTRDLMERTASRMYFSHRHFDPDAAAQRLGRILELADGFEATYTRLGDEASRRAMLDVLKLRVLGPYHASLRVRPDEYRSRQAFADRDLRTASHTFEVADPYFSPLSLYRVTVNDDVISLHSHSVDLVSVFLLEQYSYARGSTDVRAQPGDVVLDIGGCWGDTALYFASLVGAEGKVYTFEFDPENLEILNANLALNPTLAERIEIVPMALWNKSGETLQFAQAGRMTTVAPTEGSSSLQVEAVTVDDFVAEQRLDRVDFIKMDVEGAELKVIAGAEGTLRRFSPQLGIAAYHRDDDLVRIPEALLNVEQRYRLFIDSFSPAEDETVLFAARPCATRVNSSI